ncbi:MAG: DUF4122 domain-containing protein [Tannerella sp.]|jgi:hypothetical protein|nr:DUF4122 domain-containing protein [Tannerella sp.]
MEYFIYSIIKSLSAAYLLHRVFRFLFREQARDFWRFLTPETPIKGKTAVPVTETAPYNMVGKSQTVYLEELPKEQVKAIEPLFSEDLQQSPSYEEEPDIANEDVDGSLNEDRISGEDRFIPLDTDMDNGDFPSSTGMTYEQISQALDVVQGRQTDDAGRQATARILYETEGSDLFNFLTAQAENEAIVERLIKENLDNNGETVLENIRKKRRETKEFDMGKYV